MAVEVKTMVANADWKAVRSVHLQGDVERSMASTIPSSYIQSPQTARQRRLPRQPFEEAPNQAPIQGGCPGAIQDVYGRSKRCNYKALPPDLTPWRILAEVPGRGGMVVSPRITAVFHR